MLIPDISTCSNRDCKSIVINDTTGIYDAVHNEYGWGGVNILPSDITSATVTVFLPGTSPDIDPTVGYIIDVLTVLNTTVLPAYEDCYSFELATFSNQNLGNDCNLPDGIYTIVYDLTDSLGNSYKAVIKHIQICAIECCIDRMLEEAIDKKLCGKKCDDNSIKNALTARALLIQAIKYATACTDESNVEKLINAAKKLCNIKNNSNSSGDCGCGCS